MWGGQVRVRCVGAGGTGHSAWSQAASFEVPGKQLAMSQPGQGSEAALPLLGTSRSRRSGRDLRQLDTEYADTAAAKSVSIKRSSSRSLGELLYGQDSFQESAWTADSYYMPHCAIIFWFKQSAPQKGLSRAPYQCQRRDKYPEY